MSSMLNASLNGGFYTMAEQFGESAAKAFREELLPNLTVGLEDKPVKFEHKEKNFEAGKMNAEGKLESKLSRTEAFLADALGNSIRTGDLAGMSNAMNAIPDDADSAHRVLSAVRRSLETKSTSVTFQTGRDQDGQTFANMQVNRPGETLHISPQGAHVQSHMPRPEWIKPNKFEK
jgi:hypothetical protein